MEKVSCSIALLMAGYGTFKTQSIYMLMYNPEELLISVVSLLLRKVEMGHNDD